MSGLPSCCSRQSNTRATQQTPAGTQIPLQSMDPQPTPSLAPFRALPTLHSDNSATVPLNHFVDEFRRLFPTPSSEGLLPYIREADEQLRQSSLMKGHCTTWEKFEAFRESFNTELLRDWTMSLPPGEQRSFMFCLSHVIGRGGKIDFDLGNPGPPPDGVPYTDAELLQARLSRAVTVKKYSLDSLKEPKRSWEEVTTTVSLQALQTLNTNVERL